MENGQRIQQKKKKFKKICLIALPILLLSVLLAGSGISIGAIQAKYRNYTSQAQTGIQHLRKAITLLETLPKNPLDALTVSQAQKEFSAALTAFVQLDNDLNSLPGVSAYVPIYGARLSSALRLLSLTIEVSTAGVTGCTILNVLISRIRDPLNTQGQGLTMADLDAIGNDLHQVKATLNLVIDQVNQLRPEDLQLDPRISTLVTTFRNQIPALQEWLDDAEKLLTVAPAVLGIGASSNYLIEVLDSTELRPGGGFIGNYGIATFSGGRLITARITDVDLLDKPYEAAGHTIPYPPAYTWFDIAPGSWSFRDSNLDADFPTAARYGELTYKEEGGNVPVQGVVAITPTLIEHALAITGPIDVPEYHDIVTAQNLIDLIHSHQSTGSDLVPSPDGHSTPRKRFTELLAEHFLARVHQLSSAALPKFLLLLGSSLRSKDLQVYFNSSVAEGLLQRYQLDGAIQSQAGDGLFVVDANIAANKANHYIVSTLNDQVTIDAEGNAVHHTIISYAWTIPGSTYGNSEYRDYVRVYVPPGSILDVQNGWQPRGTSQAFGREVWAGFFTLNHGQTQTITLVWKVPGAARKDTSGWHYRYEIQRQAGSLWMLHVSLTPPSCALVASKRGGLVSSNKGTLTLSQTLNEDMSLGVDYACQ
jgi:Protein of unknown function (DUF4012)